MLTFCVLFYLFVPLGRQISLLNINDFAPVLIVFSVASALMSNIISIQMLKPLNVIREIIEQFNDRIYENVKDNLDSKIEELLELEKFLIWSLKDKHKKLRLEERFSKEARRVVHDMRPSVALLESAIKEMVLPNEKSKILKSAIHSLKDVSAGFLKKYTLDRKFHTIVDISESVEICPLVVDVVNKFRSIAGDIDISTLLDDKVKCRKVFVNPNLFKRVISNIVDNSIGSISGFGRILITVKLSSDQIIILVEDNGCGIPQDLLVRIFEEGFTYGKNVGTGVGLSLVAECVSYWNGSYNVLSKENIGTIFQITLPISHEDKHLSDERADKKCKYVLIDDNKLVRESWMYSAKMSNVDLHVYSCIDEFEKNIDQYDHEVVIYIDSNLGDEIPGELYAKSFYYNGYVNIYITSGVDKEHFEDMNWVKGIVDKTAPF